MFTMALPYETTSNLPLGLPTFTVSTVTYVVTECPAFTQHKTSARVISRPDENGDYADSEIRVGSEPEVLSISFQRPTDSTDTLSEGTEVPIDFDDSGTASTIALFNIRNNRSTDDFDFYTADCILKTYQG